MSIYRIDGILDEASLAAIREALDDPARFEPGRLTAGWAAREVKYNLQAKVSDFERALAGKIERALLDNEVFQAAALPKILIRTRLSRYEQGMEYGWHTDNALIEGARADLSFTLFLSDPAAYAGGELVLQDNEGESEIKLPAGHVLLYPASTLHRVAPVTRGVRLAAFGWVRSFVRESGRRDILFDLDRATRTVFAEQGKSVLFDQLAKVKANLLRAWLED